jgi:nicotinic acid mononucleotide adenylyltransferase
MAERSGHEAESSELGAVLPRVSSSELRAVIGRGERSALLPRAVQEYALAQRLYRDHA